MTSYIPSDIRRQVYDRAGGACEYCLIHTLDTFLGCQVDHIVSEKHGGETTVANLALACVFCNRSKGSDVGSYDRRTGGFVRFFNLRLDPWTDHFEFVGDRIEAVTRIGQVTASILRFNAVERQLERRALAALGRYLGRRL